MYIDWLINNTKASRGFIAQRVQIISYMAISQLFGTAYIKNHGRTNAGIPIGQILSPAVESLEGKQMECSCSISIDHDGGPSCYKEKIRTARKRHRCCECYRDIQPDEKYEYISGIWDGRPDSFKTCIDCKSLRDVFFKSWEYGNVWENFRDEFGYRGSVVPENCIAELTPGARSRVCEWIEDTWDEY